MDPSRIAYWMTKDHWTTLVALLPRSTVRHLLPQIQTLILGTGIVESYHYRVAPLYPLSSFRPPILEGSPELGLCLCYRMLRKRSHSNSELVSALRSRLNELLGHENQLYAFNPNNSHPLKEGEAWVDPHKSAEIYKMENHEWVVFIETIGKLSRIVVTMAEQDALSFTCRGNTFHLCENIMMVKSSVDIRDVPSQGVLF